MRIEHCLIVTSERSRIEMSPEELGRSFRRNMVISSETFHAWLADPEGWRIEPATELADHDTASPEPAWTPAHDKVVL